MARALGGYVPSILVIASAAKQSRAISLKPTDKALDRFASLAMTVDSIQVDINPYVFKRKSPAGFTLMEVMVALVVLGLLLAGLTQGTRLGTMAWRRQSDMVAERDQLDAVDRTLRQLIAGSMLRNSEKPDQLSFTGALPESVGLAGRRADMTLLVNDHHQLTLRWSPRRHERQLSPPVPPTDTRLLGNVERIDIAYWHNGDNATPAGWRQDGVDAAASQLVKLTVIFAESDKRHWPSVIVRSLPGSPSG